MKKRKQGINDGRFRQRGFGESLLLGVPLSLLFGGALLLLLACLALRAADPGKLTPPLSAVLLTLTALSAGFLPARLYRKNGLLIGLSGGLALSFISAVSGILLGGGMTPQRALSYLAILLLGAFGGVLGGAKRRVRRPRPKY